MSSSVLFFSIFSIVLAFSFFVKILLFFRCFAKQFTGFSYPTRILIQKHRKMAFSKKKYANIKQTGRTRKHLHTDHLRGRHTVMTPKESNCMKSKQKHLFLCLERPNTYQGLAFAPYTFSPSPLMRIPPLFFFSPVVPHSYPHYFSRFCDFFLFPKKKTTLHTKKGKENESTKTK